MCASRSSKTSTAPARRYAAFAICSAATRAKRPPCRLAANQRAFAPTRIMQLKPVNVGLVGLGTVGGGTVNVLKRKAQEIERRAGSGIVITRAAARDLKRTRNCDTVGITLTDDPFAVVDDPDVEDVVELIGGTTPARDLVRRAIANGKRVVTASKALLAKYVSDVLAEAQRLGYAEADPTFVVEGIDAAHKLTILASIAFGILFHFD